MVTAQWVIGGDLDQDDPDAIGVLDPHLDQPPALRCGLPDDRNSGRSQPGMLAADIPDLDPDHHRARQDRPRARRPRGIPSRGRTPPRDHPGDRTPGRRPGPGRRGRSGGCGPGRGGAGGSGCSERPRHYSSITMSDAGGQRRTRAVPPICAAEPVPAAFFPGASPRLGLLPKAITGEEGAPFSPSPGVLIASRVRSAWRQQRADGRVAGWSSNAGAARTVTFTGVAFAVQKTTVGRLDNGPLSLLRPHGIHRQVLASGAPRRQPWRPHITVCFTT
jgi:hypothetical protein